MSSGVGSSPPEIDTVSELVSLIKEDLCDGPWIIGIDGIDGVGKSPLARELAPMLDATAIELDDYVESDRGNYVEFLDVDDVKRILEDNDRVILDGVCMLAAAKRLDVVLDRHIYVKRMKRYPHLVEEQMIWRDREECNPPDDIEGYLADQKAELQAFSKFFDQLEGRETTDATEARLTPLREEIIRYHGQYRPHLVADIIFHRYEDD